MKKNLIGAVAAGLALAFAFTACESGNDNPIRIPTDADAAVYEKKTFDYKAAPTEYTEITKKDITTLETITPVRTVTYNTTDAANYESVTSFETGVDTTLSTSVKTTNAYYDWSKYVDGINSYNRKSGTWSGKADKGKEIGDVVNTKFVTLSLNSVDKTFKYSTTTSAYAVRGLRTREYIKYDATNTYGNVPKTGEAVARTYVMKKLTDTTSYDTLPYYVLATVETYLPTSTSVASDAVNYTVADTFASNCVPLAGTGDYPYLVQGRAVSHAAARTIIEGALKYAKDVLKEKEQALITTTDTSGTGVSSYDAAVKVAKENVAKLDNLLKQSEYYERGARVSILDTTTVDEKTTGSIKYYEKIDGKLIATEDKAATSEDANKKAWTGKFTINGNYLNSSEVLITEFTQGKNKYVFTDADNYYYKNDVRGVITEDFPQATAYNGNAATSKKGSTYQKAARVLNLANGTITGPGVDVNYTNHTAKNDTTTLNRATGRTGYFFGSSYNSYNLYYETFKEIVPVSNATNCETPVSYSYVKQ